MKVLMVAASALFASRVAAGGSEQPSLAQVVLEIRAADYHGARGELQTLGETLDRIKDPKLAPYRDYWRGFASWRRALNGFNETPPASDLEDDLKAGIVSFRKALVEKPDWIEALIGIQGCGGPMLYLARGDAARTNAILKDFIPVAHEVSEKGLTNPRALWLMGQNQLAAPPPYGGDPVKAAATFRRGIEAALVETRQVSAPEPSWIPRWGGAENLMSLAYLYSHSALEDRDLALAYADGSMVAVPEWHYVRDVLLPQILNLPRPASGDSH
jgi:hypothetical protein